MPIAAKAGEAEDSRIFCDNILILFSCLLSVLREEKTESQRRERSGHDAIVRSRRSLAVKLETSNGGKE
jgi:hypothetical protein